jgi:aspartyl-tRNA(Asn)/glutamyl-tRNA(Gln) amidotransferase subunit C
MVQRTQVGRGRQAGTGSIRPGRVLPVAKPAFRRLLGGRYSPTISAGSDLNIDYVANLARLALTDEEKARFARQLGDILHYVDKLKQVDVTGIEPMAHAAPVFNVWQEDKARAGLTVDQALQNAPAQRQNMVVVPKVVE